MIILDASAAVEWLMDSPVGQNISKRLSAAGREFHAPHLLDLEVAQAFRRMVNKRFVSEHRAEQALENLADSRCVRHSHYLLLPRIWELRDNMSAYDAAYVALAEELGIVMITCDSRLASAPGHLARVDLIRA